MTRYPAGLKYAVTVVVSLILGYHISPIHDRIIGGPTSTRRTAVLSTATQSIVVNITTATSTTSPTVSTTISGEALKARLATSKAPQHYRDELTLRDELYVGVVTAASFLQTRALTINGTWGHKAPKLEYFASKGERKHNLPVISLPGVDDTYPPQKKVFRMWKYIHDHYIDQYNWFLRADDDVYVRIPKLIQFLSKLDPTEDLYIGSPGYGRPEDRERIKLYPNENYCMGGPGVVLSRALLKKLVPHLDECLENVVVSYNEDVELGRCISRRLGVQCTRAYEMRQLYSNKGESIDYTKVYSDDGFAQNTITIHPFKSKQAMYQIHRFFLEIASKDAMKQAKTLNTELKEAQTVTLTTNVTLENKPK